MTTTISYMTSIRSQHPTHGRLYIENRTRAMVPGSMPYTLSECDYEFHFNPLLDLSSPRNASSFMSGVVAAMEYQARPEIADEIAAFALREVSGGGWLSGLSLWVFLETNHVVLGGQRSEESAVTLGGMSDWEISMLRKEKVSSDEKGECCICLEGFLKGAVITPLAPCSHRFHHGCIVPWLRNNRTCPICRRRTTTVPVLKRSQKKFYRGAQQ